MLRNDTLDDFIDHLKETYDLSPGAWQAFKDQVEAIGRTHGEGTTLRYEYDVENNTITVSVADIQRQKN
jgi:YD repeat-containing protein